MLKSFGYSYIDSINIDTTPLQLDQNSIEDVANAIKNCYLCDFSKSRKAPLTGSGSSSAKVMIVDHTVSLTQDSSGNYFAGKSGEMLQAMVENVLHLDTKNDIFFTHAIKCKPSPHAKGFEVEWNSCKSYLFKQIDLLKPKIVIALGKEAYAKLSGDKEENFQNIRGSIIKLNSYTLVAIHHPSYLLKNPQEKRVAFGDLQRIEALL